MEKVSVNKDDLREKVQANRDAHRGVFESAMAGYREQVMTWMEEQLQRIAEGKRFSTQFRLPPPMDHTGDYDRVLVMIEMAIGDTIELGERDFMQYVMDDWGWKQNFLASASNYTAVDEYVDA